jgi:hypothetical protein
MRDAGGRCDEGCSFGVRITHLARVAEAARIAATVSARARGTPLLLRFLLVALLLALFSCGSNTAPPTPTDIREGSAWPRGTLCARWADVRAGNDIDTNLKYLTRNADMAASLDARWRPWNAAVVKIARDVRDGNKSALQEDGAELTRLCSS